MAISPITLSTGIVGDDLTSLLALGVVAAVELAIWLTVRTAGRRVSVPVRADEELTLRRWLEAHR